MGELSELLKRESVPANPAKTANLAPSGIRDSQDSQDSQGGDAENIRAQRDRLLTLAESEGIDPVHVHRLHDDDLRAIPSDYAEHNLTAYLRALAARERMDAGMVPLVWGEPVTRTCEGCGPVLLWQGCPDVVKACAWCFKRKAGKPIPRPLVTCGDCIHYAPDPLNPTAGAGTCNNGCSARWPMQGHRCAEWRASQSGTI